MRIAVLKGGPSSEREVSLRSGAAVARGLREAGHDVVEVDVTGRDLELGGGVDVVFIALHGEFGEDGGVQEILESRGIPYTGSDAESSRRSFNKVLTQEALAANGIPTPAYEVLTLGGGRSLPLPVVLKPACQGSSIGVHRVMAEDEWGPALEDALSYGAEVLVEEFIHGREFTVGIVGDEVLPVVEIEAPDHWYGYDAKYTVGACRYVVPARIDDELRDRCRKWAWKAFEVLGCRGFARVDFLADADGEVYVLELNSIPGFTETSLLPKAAAEAGMSFSELCDRIARGARVIG